MELSNCSQSDSQIREEDRYVGECTARWKNGDVRAG